MAPQHPGNKITVPLKSSSWRAILFVAGAFGGFLLAWQGRAEAEIQALLARLCLAPLAGGVALWLAGILLASLKDKGQTRPALAGWLRLVRLRWPFALGLPLLALAGWFCLYQADLAGRSLVRFGQANAQTQANGWRVWRYQPGDWQAPPQATWLAPALSYSSANDARFQADWFFIRAAGLLRLAKPARFQMALESDDGALLMVDGRRAIDNLGSHPPVSKMAEVRLSAGMHVLEVLYWQRYLGASLRLSAPAWLAQSLSPFKPGLDARSLWHLNRWVQIWRARSLACLAAGGLLLVLLLTPVPAWSPSGLWARARRNWPYLALAGGAAGLMFFGLGSWPGLEGDEAWFGMTASYMHWYGWARPHVAAYAMADALTLPVYWLQHLFPLTAGLVRAVPVLLNSAGLLFLAAGLGRAGGRAAGLMAALLLASCPWFLFLGRLAWEATAYFTLCGGLMVFGISRARETWWGAPLAGVALGFLLKVHALHLGLAFGAGLAVLALAGWRLWKMPRFWLAVAGLLFVVWPRLWAVFSQPGGLASTGGVGLTPRHLAEHLLVCFGKVLPHGLSGRWPAIMLSGQEPSLAFPLLPLLITGLLAAWAFAPLGRQGGPLRRGLAWFCLGSLLAACLLAPVASLKNFSAPLAGLCLLGGALLAGLWQAGRRALAGALLALALGLNLAVYLHDGYASFAASGGALYDFQAPTPGSGYWKSANRTVDKRGLYNFLVKHGRPVAVKNYWLAQPLLFHEVEEIFGRRGLVLGDPAPGRLMAGFARVDTVDRAWNQPDQAWKLPAALAQKARAKRLTLPPGLADKFQVYVVEEKP